MGFRLHTYVRARARRAATVALLVLGVGVTFGVPAMGGTSTVTVSFNAAGWVSVTNTCQDPSATQFGTAIAGSPTMTDTGAGACQFGFGASQTSMLRMAQADGRQTAMASINANGTDVFKDNAAFSVSFASTSVGWLTAYGVTRKTTDGGVSWSANISLPVNTNYYGVHAIDANTAVAVASTGRIYRGTAGADTAGKWGQVKGAGNRLWGVDGSGATLWAVGDGGVLYRSQDSGATWGAPIVVGGGAIDLYDVTVVSATTAYAVGSSCRIYKTTNGNAVTPTWNQVHDCGTNALHDVDAASASAVTAVGDYGLVCSTSDGTTWPGGTCGNLTGSRYRLQAVSRSSANDVLVRGAFGWQSASTNGGATFTGAPSTHGFKAMDMARLDATTVVAVGYGMNALRSADNAATWTLQAADSRAHTDVEWVGPGDAVIVGDEGLIHTTTDWGTTRTPRTSGTTAGLRGVAYAGGTRVVAVGSGGTVIYSTDLGVNWSPGVSGTTEHLMDVEMYDQLTGWAVGTNGTLLVTADGGLTWSPQASGTTAHFVSVSVVDDQVVWAAAIGGIVRRTINAGSNWTAASSGDPDQHGILGISDQEAFVGAGWSEVLRTTNGGSSWSDYGFSGANIYHVDRAGTGIVIAGDGGQVRITPDGGATWLGTGTTDVSTNAIAGDDVNGILTVGDGGFINRTSAGVAMSDYGGGNTWASATTNSLFGVCLQELTGVGAVADWTVDGAGTANQCEANDADPWNAVPTSWSKIAHTANPGDSATATFVWGARPATTTPPGDYYASIVVEVVAPNA